MNTKYIYLSVLLVLVGVLSLGLFQLSTAFSGGFTIQNVENLNVAGDSVNGSVAPSVSPETDEFGAVVNITRHNFPQGVKVSANGGGLLAITSGSKTFSAADICDNVLVTQNNIGAPASAQTNTFPTAASLITRCLPDKGDYRTVRFENIAGPGEVFTFRLGTGIDIFVASGSAVVAGKGDGAKLWPEAAAFVRFTNLNGSSVSVDFVEMINAD